MKRTAIWAIIALAAPTLAAADPGDNWQEGYGHMMWGGGYGVFGGLMMILFWGIVIALIVFGVKWMSDNRGPGGNRRDALEILRERFASGEIDEEEFDRRRKALEK
ncbi:SHOCT domain-containing protein [Palleronia pelagia]|uniref:Putative membrane protein n=1 Tax=Palleronia pelagia TaxID=387096 RepID=A0A1H8MBE6_9RHOB|nr:SHOCT domain-containing protein [Palleronia pelagia]SEO14600.1 putative membrane protein [Palleronia pelagia]